MKNKSRSEPARAINPGFASQLGNHPGSHATNKAEPLTKAVQRMDAGLAYNSGVALGNTKALDVGGGGPGTGRTIMPAGSQSPTPPAKPAPKGTDILNQFGPNVRR